MPSVYVSWRLYCQCQRMVRAGEGRHTATQGGNGERSDCAEGSAKREAYVLSPHGGVMIDDAVNDILLDRHLGGSIDNARGWIITTSRRRLLELLGDVICDGPVFFMITYVYIYISLWLDTNALSTRVYANFCRWLKWRTIIRYITGRHMITINDVSSIVWRSNEWIITIQIDIKNNRG